MAKLAGGEPVLVTCPQNNGFKPRAEDIEAAITPKTKWLMLNYPEQPDRRRAARAAELRAIADVMLQPSACLGHVGRHVRAPGVSTASGFCTIAEVDAGAAATAR